MKKQNDKINQPLPPIPLKRFFSIREAAKLCGVKPHVLRYWEAEFTKLNPTKGNGGHRHYTNKDIELVREIRHLLYDKGFTIAGAKQQLKQGKKEQITLLPQEENAAPAEISEVPQISQDLQKPQQPLRQFISQMVVDLEDLLSAAEVGGV